MENPAAQVRRIAAAPSSSRQLLTRAALGATAEGAGESTTGSDGNDDDGRRKVRRCTPTLRDRLRTATGFSFTVFRATLRGITGVSLTAIYASTVAATGLWIRKLTSVVLGILPPWFRYFLQPVLVLYYAPLFIVRSATGRRNRERAVAKHRAVLEGWREAVEYAERTERNGYWPVVVNEDGYFEMVTPPHPDGVVITSSSDDGATTTTKPSHVTQRQEMADAMAVTVEHAMEVVNDATAANSRKA
jgi:hypothetical protein